MRTPLVLALLFTGCAGHRPCGPSATAALPPRLEEYFERYCDDTGSLGIGFVPSHTYDYRFRQRLRSTQDPELKRLFVLQQLYKELDGALDDFRRGIRRTGKSSLRSLSLLEWRSTKEKINGQIDDLEVYSGFTNYISTVRDPLDPPEPRLDRIWVDELRSKLRTITNSPESEAVQRNGASGSARE